MQPFEMIFGLMSRAFVILPFWLLFFIPCATIYRNYITGFCLIKATLFPNVNFPSDFRMKKFKLKQINYEMVKLLFVRKQFECV